MKQDHTPARRAAWLLLAAPALLISPAHAQDTTQTAPPPVQRTVPDAPAPAAAPAPQAAPPVAAETASTTSRTTIAPGAREVVDEARIEAQRAARPARQAARQPVRAPRPAVTRPAAAIAPVAVAPAAAPAPAPVAAAPATDPVGPAPETDPVAPAAAPEAAAPVDTATAATQTTTTETGGTPLWPLFLIAGLIILAGVGYAMWSRRRARAEVYEAEPDYYEQPAAYAEPVQEPAPAYVAPAAAAAAAAPLVHHDAPVAEPVVATEDATLTEAEAEEVAALTGGTAPVSNRPWLEFAMRPVRAGTSADEALVEIELTVANSGNQAARDVRVSAFMLTERQASDMENALVDRAADTAVDPVTIEPGEGARIDATLAALKADIGEEGEFSPVVVADARYTLPDGTEGRTSASFVVGITREGGTISPIDLADRVMREDIEARLHGQPQHA